MPTVVYGDYTSIMTNGWWHFSDAQTIYEKIYVTVPLPDTKPKRLTELESLESPDKTLIGIIPASGIKKQLKFTLTYDGQTEWFYFETPYPRLRSKDNMTLFDYHKVMQKTLKILDEDIAYVPSYPDYLLTDEDESYIADTKQAPKKIITYQTIRSEPGKISTGPPFQGTGVKELKYRVREQLFLDPLFRKDIDDPAEKLRYFKSEGQWYDNLVQFDLWTKTNYEAEEFIEWFENFLDKYRGMFKELGMQEMLYYRRVRDDSIIKWKNKLTVRSLIYYFRTEKLKITEIRPIKRINVTTNLMHYNYIYPSARLVENEEQILKKWLRTGG